MTAMRSDPVMHGSVFAWIAAAIGVLLLVPLVAMQFTDEVNWGAGDFALMAALLFGFAALFLFAARKLARRHWWPLGAAITLLFLYLWAELAVGVFLSIGS